MTALLFALAAAPSGSIKIHIDGEGLLRFARGSQAVYSSDATLMTNSGVLASPEGYPLLPQIRVPSDGLGVKVEMDGTVLISGKTAGRIVLASFGAGQLQKIGNYWTATTRSNIGYPGEGVFGIVRLVKAKGGAKAASTPKAPVAPSNPTVEISLRTEIEKPHILLGDIATIHGAGDGTDRIAAIDLGATPVFGAERGISRVYVLAALRHEGIDTDKLTLLCPVGATAIRKGQKVDEAAIVAAATAGVKSRLGVDVELRADRPIADFFVPVGDLQFNTIQAVPSGDGYSVNLEIDVDGKMFTRRSVVMMPTVATPQIHTGDPLKIRILKNGATVEISGKARANGKVGGTMTVETESGATFTGMLRSPSLVEVKL